MHGTISGSKQPPNDQAVLDSILRSDFTAFIQKAFATVSPGDDFSANWHIEAMAHELTLLMRGENRRLIITIPPRHLKSICTSVALPAFILGHDPAGAMATKAFAGIRWLLDHGADPNVPAYDYKARPVHLAAANGWSVTT